MVYTNGSLQGSYNAYTSIIGARPAFRLKRSTRLSGSDSSICRITDPDLFTEGIQNAITFDSESVTCGTRDGMIYFDKKNIAAPQLDTEYVIKINGHEYQYSALDYSSLSYSKDNKPYSESIAKQLSAAVYRYNQAANDFFGD